MGFFTDRFKKTEKQLGEIAVHLNLRLEEVRDRWTDLCLIILDKMKVEPKRSTFSKDGLACVTAFQYYMFTQLSHEKGYIHNKNEEEFFDLIANILVQENHIPQEIFKKNLKYFHEASDSSTLIFRLAECVAKDLIGKEAVLGYAVAISSIVNLFIAMTKMITAESFEDYKTATKFQNILDNSASS